MAQFTINIPNDKVAMVGRAYGVVQEEEETPDEALTRLKAALIWALKRPVEQMRTREINAANVASDTADAITEV